MKKLFFLGFFGLLLSCKSFYISPQFDSKTESHQTMAILPVEVIHLGKVPPELSDNDIKEIEIAESKAFQISFYRELLNSTRRGRKNLKVQLQDYQKTLSVLSDHQISIQESWAMSSEQLSEILEVESVVRTRIEKTRFMSDLASYGIEVATHVVNVLSNYSVGWWLPAQLGRSKEIRAQYRLTSESDELLWSISFDVDADWRSPSREIIDNITRRAARKFPYRL